MLDYSELIQRIQGSRLQPLADALPQLVEEYFSERLHGDLPGWLAQLQTLPDIPAATVELNSAAISVAQPDISAEQRQQVEACLRQFIPWRKGPFSIHGVYVDAEWRSDWKWERLLPHINALHGRSVLDVGCGSGYHCWRMAGAGAELVIGIEPSPLFVLQHQLIKHFVGDSPTFVLPLTMEAMPPQMMAFDTVFSMGVLYHRRSPLDHLIELRDSLRRGGELVLETLVIDGDKGDVLMPEDRYAKMRNVWFLPSAGTLALWLRRCGFKNIRMVDQTPTSLQEQRATDWTLKESLVDYLAPGDTSKTLEGYPAPLRAIFIAESP